MDFQNPTAKSILNRLKYHPLDLPAWQDLTMLALEQKQSEAFRSYQLVVDGLDQLVNRRPNDTIFGPTYAPPTLEDCHKDLVFDCALEPLEARHLGELARLLLEEAYLPLPARRLASHASKLEPSTREWDRLVDKCKLDDQIDIGVRQTEFEPEEAHSTIIRHTKPREISELKGLMMTSIRVTPELMGEQESVVDVSKTARMPHLDAVQAGSATASGPAWGQLLNQLLTAIQQESYSEVSDLLQKNESEAEGSADPAYGLLYLIGGIFLHRESRQNEAVELYQQALMRLPSASALMFYQASTYHELGMLDEAVGLYELTARALPEHHAVWNNLATIYRGQGKGDEAAAAAEKAVSLHPDAVMYQRNYAAILFDNGEVQKAADLLAAQVERQPEDSDLVLQYALALYELSDYVSAQQYLEKRIQLKGGDPEGAAYLAICHAQQSQGVPAYELISELKPTEVNRALLITAWIQVAFALEKNDRQDLALRLLEKALHHDETNAGAWLRKGLILKRQGKLDEALVALELASTHAPFLARAWGETGMIHYSRKGYITAVEKFQRAADLDPAGVDWTFNAAVAWEKLEDLEKAQDCYRRTINLDPDHMGAHTNLALILIHRGEIAPARTLMDQMVERHPGSASGWFALGCVCEQQQDLDAAMAAYRKSLELNPEMEAARKNLDVILDSLDRDD